MFKISSEKELRESFRLLDREEVILSDSLRFPIVVKDYLTWTEPSGVRQYLIFSDRAAAPPLGIVFRRDQSAGAAPVMCEWCHSVRGGEGIGLLSATASANRRVGLNLCRDLSCKAKLEALVDDSYMKSRQLLVRMAQFARRELF